MFFSLLIRLDFITQATLENKTVKTRQNIQTGYEFLATLMSIGGSMLQKIFSYYLYEAY